MIPDRNVHDAFERFVYVRVQARREKKKSFYEAGFVLRLY